MSPAITFNEMLDLPEDPGLLPGDAALRAHLTVELLALFSFLVDLDLDVTNWRTEQASVRP